MPAPLSKTAKYYRDNPEARDKHNKSSKKWNKSKKGKSYYKAKNSSAEEVKKNLSRKKARAKFIKKGLVKKGDGKVIDHKNKNAKDNSSGNLRVMSASSNNKRNKR